MHKIWDQCPHHRSWAQAGPILETKTTTWEPTVVCPGPSGHAPWCLLYCQVIARGSRSCPIACAQQVLEQRSVGSSPDSAGMSTIWNFLSHPPSTPGFYPSQFRTEVTSSSLTHTLGLHPRIRRLRSQRALRAAPRV